MRERILEFGDYAVVAQHIVGVMPLSPPNFGPPRFAVLVAGVGTVEVPRRFYLAARRELEGRGTVVDAASGEEIHG